MPYSTTYTHVVWKVTTMNRVNRVGIVTLCIVYVAAPAEMQLANVMVTLCLKVRFKFCMCNSL